MSNVKPNIKVVLLGDSGVGKSSLVFRWVTGIFNEKIKPTIGTNHQVKNLNLSGKDVDVFLWDTAGQEQFHALAPLYVRQSSAVVIVASAANLESLNSVKTWIELVENSCDKIPPMILAVNKIDLIEDLSCIMENVKKSQNQQFPKIFFVSAASGECVDVLFLEASQEGYDFKMRDSDCIVQETNAITNAKQPDSNSCCV